MAFSRHHEDSSSDDRDMTPVQPTVEPMALHAGSLFLRSLPAQDLRRLVPHLALREFPREEVIHQEGDMIESVIFPHGSTVSLTSLFSDGTMVESATVGSEGYVGVEVMLGSAIATSSAIAQEGQASVITLGQLLLLLDQVPSLRPAMLIYARSFLGVVMRLAACNARHSLKQRACRRLLLTLAQTEHRPLMITQKDLASALGVSRTSVNETCKELRHSGIIEYSRGHIQILNLHAMTECACECYTYLKSMLQL
jgi:CRP-like cAMP-binding protein